MRSTLITRSLLAMLLGVGLSACGGSSSGGETGGSSQSRVAQSSANSSEADSESSSESSDLSSAASSTSSAQSSSEPDTAQVCDQSPPETLVAAEVENAPVAVCLVVDQFGYLPSAQKVAVLRDPQAGFDSGLSFAPGEDYALVNVDSGEVVHTGSPSTWNEGAISDISGDKAWWFDFSAVTDPGRYVVWDRSQNVRSPAFSIGADVYKPVLKDAVRTFFYQRAGDEKLATHAGTGWADGASHLGEGQDPAARLYGSENDASTERDLRGGWYDAGDYNKYTNWHADYLVVLMHTYRENPGIWTDDFNIPESGNGIPDLLDELKWGMDWLIRMQEDDGSVLSVMGLAHASPPSSATGPSVYGPATTSATLTSAQAFAFGSVIFAQVEGWETYAQELATRAENAWDWADAHPSVTFENSGKVAAGEQEVDDDGRAMKKRIAALYLFAATGESDYKTFAENEYRDHPITWVGPWNEPETTHWLYYASLPDATDSVVNDIRTAYTNGMNGHWEAVTQAQDAYRAYLGESNFTWGSNRTMARQGLTFTNLAVHGLGDAGEQAIDNAALGYLNYLHGTNPLGKVYLSNMYHLDVHNSVDSFYHSWFSDGSANWDSVKTSNYGPAPGYLVGGPNPSYSWDACCPDSCGGSENNARCGAEELSPPADQPAAKAYLDFNTSWPVNSWQVTENHNDYQVAYIRLLSRFVK
ncbi:glycoside hydrolase family 9 protein [Marinimicrobium agarilyticum]|uniref:glycoside hydrolase family 9 protein n=1 Tax=Marinimicrobium agarilyticum TaxID=306546 RepID=UPI0003F6A20B|nr:glycoside hydrolase family 9 protein [Marinimicrobium agarilyticum]